MSATSRAYISSQNLEPQVDAMVYYTNISQVSWVAIGDFQTKQQLHNILGCLMW